MKDLKIAIGADHGGFELKSQLLGWLRDKGCPVQDCGTHSKDAVDYPRIAYTVARLVASGQCDRGIMIDGAGIGSAMTANKVLGVRAAACYSVALAKNSREHNDANVLTFGAGQTNFEQATPIVEMFLTTDCVEERHRKRVQLINAVQEGPIEVGPHQATLLAGAGEPRPAPTEPDLEKVAKRVQELLAEQGKPIVAPPAVPPLNIPQLIDHTILRPDTTQDRHRTALPRGAPIQVLLGLREPDLGVAGPPTSGWVGREGLLRRRLSAGRAAAGNQGHGSPRRDAARGEGN